MNSAGTGIDWATVIPTGTFTPVVEGIVGLFPQVLAVVLPLIVLRKGWDFIKGNIYSA